MMLQLWLHPTESLTAILPLPPVTAAASCCCCYSCCRDQLAQPLPVAAASNTAYVQARAQGLDDMDFSAVIEALVASRKK
jgi:hypothetical protein